MRISHQIGLMLALIASGCSAVNTGLALPVAGKDSIHYIVLGFGIVSVPKSDKATAVLATKTQALGMLVSDQPGSKISIGYSSGSVVVIPDGAEDVRVEISHKLWGPITITAPSATLKPMGGK